MNITYGQLRTLVQEALKEANVAANAGGYSTPKAFKSTANKPFAYRVERPKRPSHTKFFDFLEEDK